MERDEERDEKVSALWTIAACVVLLPAKPDHISLCLPALRPVNACDSSHNATNITDVTCREEWAAICSMLHRKSAVFRLLPVSSGRETISWHAGNARTSQPPDCGFRTLVQNSET